MAFFTLLECSLEPVANTEECEYTEERKEYAYNNDVRCDAHLPFLDLLPRWPVPFLAL
jgi:hypothetical protein